MKIISGFLMHTGFLSALLIFPGLMPGAAHDDFETAKQNHESYNFALAFPVFERLAKQGDKRAQYYVGRMYHLGEGRLQDRMEASRWYRMSADQGFARAQNNLGVLQLERGNVAEAIMLFKKAAAQGLPQAKTNLAIAVRQERLRKRSAKSGPPASPTIQRAPVQRDMNDPTMEFRFHRLREGMR
jgi:TPR repeat protein